MQRWITGNDIAKFWRTSQHLHETLRIGSNRNFDATSPCSPVLTILFSEQLSILMHNHVYSFCDCSCLSLFAIDKSALKYLNEK